MRVGEGDPLVAVDEVVVAGEAGAQLPDRAERRRRVAEHLGRDAADVDDVDREEVAQVGCIGHGAKLSGCSVSGTLAGVTASGRRPGKAAIMRAAVEVIAEDGFEGASIRDMAARAGVSVAALYHHFPSKLGLLREFLDEAYAVTLARIERRLDGVEGAVARLENVVGTLVWTHLHDEFARRASVVASREYTRLDPPDRAADRGAAQGAARPRRGHRARRHPVEGLPDRRAA